MKEFFKEYCHYRRQYYHLLQKTYGNSLSRSDYVTGTVLSFEVCKSEICVTSGYHSEILLLDQAFSAKMH